MTEQLTDAERIEMRRKLAERVMEKTWPFNVEYPVWVTNDDDESVIHIRKEEFRPDCSLEHMYIVEEKLLTTSEMRVRYSYELLDVVFQARHDQEFIYVADVVHATAEQRARAAVKVIDSMEGK